MIRRIALSVAALMASCNPVYAEQARFLVCPPHLSYCYYEFKPILPQKRARDEYNDIKREIDRDLAAVEYRMKLNENGYLWGFR